MVGLEYSLEDIVEAPAGSEISRDMKWLKEVRERAANLQKLNRGLEEKVSEFQKLVENQDIENREIREKHSHASLNYMQKIEKLKEEQRQKAHQVDQTLKDNLRERNEEL